MNNIFTNNFTMLYMSLRTKLKFRSGNSFATPLSCSSKGPVVIIKSLMPYVKVKTEKVKLSRYNIKTFRLLSFSNVL